MRARILLIMASLAASAAVAQSWSGARLVDWNQPGGWSSRASASVASTAATFDLIAGSTTPNDLPDTLMMNGTAMTLVWAGDAGSISGTTWPGRSPGGTTTFTGSALGAGIATPFHALDSTERVTTTASGAVAAPSTSFGDIGAGEDLVVEFVSKIGYLASAPLTKKASTETVAAGWAYYGDANGFQSFEIADGTTRATAVGIRLTDNAFNHYIMFVDRDSATGMQVCLNGSCGTATNPTAVTGSLATATAMTLSAGPPGSGSFRMQPASIRVWKCTGCLNGSTENAATARERTSIAFGVRPTIAAGSPIPTTMTRAVAAFTDVIQGTTRAIYSIGANAPRVTRRGAGGVAVVGYLSEPQGTSVARQSQTLGTTWAALTVGDNVLADAFVGPDLTTVGDNIDCATGTNVAECGLRIPLTLTATTHTFSTWAFAGQNTVVALRNATVTNAHAFFNLTTCAACNQLSGDCTGAVGTVGAGVSQARAERYAVDSDGNGVADVELCRVSITFVGTAASHNIDLLCADADNDFLINEAADATGNCGFTGAQVEAFPTATSYIATTTASVTRTADDLRYDGVGNYTGDPTTMDVAVLCPSFDVASNSTFASVGPTATSAALGILATGDRPRALQSTWDIQSASGDVADGAAHSIRTTMATNSIEAFYDGVSFGTDVVATLPVTASSFIFLGTTGGTAAQSACLTTRTRIWPRLVTPAGTP